MVNSVVSSSDILFCSLGAVAIKEIALSSRWAHQLSQPGDFALYFKVDELALFLLSLS